MSSAPTNGTIHDSNPTGTNNDNHKTQKAPDFANNEDLLRYVYADLTRLGEVASDDVVLHRFNDPANPHRGRAAVQAHEEGFVAATNHTLVMDVESLTANAHFGAVLGTIRARKDGLDDLAVPFAGIWRFAGGRVVEHWENAYCDLGEMGEWLAAGGN